MHGETVKLIGKYNSLKVINVWPLILQKELGWRQSTRSKCHPGKEFGSELPG